MPRRKNPSEPVRTLGNIAALVPVDNDGEPMGPAQEWRMTAGDNAADPGAPSEDEDDESPGDRLVTLLQGVRGQDRAFVRVSRVTREGKPAFCTEYTPEEFEAGGLQRLREDWGPGEYHLMVYAANDQGRMGIRTRQTVTIAAAIRALSAPATSSAPAIPSELSAALSGIVEGQRAIAELLARQHATPPKTALESMTEMASFMKLMREASPQPASQTTALGELIEGMKQIQGVSKMMGGNRAEPDEDSLGGLLGKVLPVISEGLKRRDPPVLPRLQAPAAIAGAGALPDTVTDTDTGMPTQNLTPEQEAEMLKEAAAAIQMKGYISALVHMAKSPEGDGYVERAANLVYDKLPDEMLDMLDLPVWFELLSEQVPAVAPYREWFTKVRDRVLEIFAEVEAQQPDGDEDAEPAPEAPAEVAAPATPVTPIRGGKKKA